jgi:hypothetical protein
MSEKFSADKPNVSQATVKKVRKQNWLKETAKPFKRTITG